MAPFSTSVWEMPLARLVALSFLAGVLFALAVVHFPYRIRRRLSDRKQDRRIREFERELDRLRDVPLGVREDSVVVEPAFIEPSSPKALDDSSGDSEPPSEGTVIDDLPAD